MTKEPSMRGDREQVVAGGWAGRGVGLAGRRARRLVRHRNHHLRRESPQLSSRSPWTPTPRAPRSTQRPSPSEALVLGSGNTMGNIIVWVSKGVPAGKTFPAPKTPVTLDQNGCQYKPHAQGIMVGQPYKILNSDGILHNVHSLPKVNRQFNKPMPPTLKETTTTFTKPEPIFQIKCDVHPWMTAYIGVFTHPFFSVTGTDGKFTISGLDAGTYEITAWHERLGTQTASVTVAASDTKTQDFKFAMPAAK